MRRQFMHGAATIRWLAVPYILSLVFVGCALTCEPEPGSPTPTQVPPPDHIIATAKAKARDVFGPHHGTYDVIVRELDLSHLGRPLEHHWAFLAEGLFKLPPARCVVIVSRPGDAYAMPDQFAQVVAGEGLAPGAPQDFPAVVDLFAKLAANGRVVARARDIPWDGGLGKDPAAYADDISPPRLDASCHPPRGRFCTWAPVGGVLTKWAIQLPASGEFVVEEKRQLGARIGKFEVLQ